MACFFVDRLFIVAILFFLTALFRLAFALGFDIFIPGIFCMSWPCALTLPVDVGISAMIINTLNPNRRMTTPTFSLFMVPPLIVFAINEKQDALRKRAHVGTRLPD